MTRPAPSCRLGPLALLALLSLAGCARLQWTRSSVDEPLDGDRLDALRPDHDDLGSCLRALGAPLRVWEAPDAGVALAWGWLDDLDWGFDISWAFDQFASVSFDWAEQLQRLRGAVLVFDHDLVLRQVRRGWLREIAPDLRRRPAAVE